MAHHGGWIQTPDEILRFGLLLANFSICKQETVLSEHNIRRFKSHFGSSPLVCAAIWADLISTDIQEARIIPFAGALDKFFLSLFFLKTCATEEKLSAFSRSCEKVARRWVWFFVSKLQALKTKKVKRMIIHVFCPLHENPELTFVDKDCMARSLEWGLSPWLLVLCWWCPLLCKRDYSSDIGERYEALFTQVQPSWFRLWARHFPYWECTCLDEWTFQGFQTWCDNFSLWGSEKLDNALTEERYRWHGIPRWTWYFMHSQLPGFSKATKIQGEYTLYAVDVPLVFSSIFFSQVDMSLVLFKQSRARARHETFNSKIKNFAYLDNRFRHGMDKHKMCFEALCVIAQYQLENGSPLFDI